MLEILNESVDVLAYSKLDRKHKLKISYRDETSILRNYEVDFIVKTESKNYLVETKADKDINSPNVAVKANATVAWCEQASTVVPVENINQAREWEYLTVSESVFKNHKGLSFEAFVPLCRSLRDNIYCEGKRSAFAIMPQRLISFKKPTILSVGTKLYNKLCFASNLSVVTRLIVPLQQH